MNDASELLHYWTTEIALPLSEVALYSKSKVPLVSSSFWRINFSRVQWPVRVVLDGHISKKHYEKRKAWMKKMGVELRVCCGPEWWGYLQFRPRDENALMITDGGEIVPLDPEGGAICKFSVL
ncbi:unnamed protein product [Peronospora destructor]|uniref:Uncharacterized protein n=1 Tax=Peronospora destructor TaxID=86335 RepID=A0AAV0U0X9_9STRA|nr:unnamed protein product [Peronospora destructor]